MLLLLQKSIVGMQFWQKKGWKDQIWQSHALLNKICKTKPKYINIFSQIRNSSKSSTCCSTLGSVFLLPLIYAAALCVTPLIPNSVAQNEISICTTARWWKYELARLCKKHLQSANGQKKRHDLVSDSCYVLRKHANRENKISVELTFVNICHKKQQLKKMSIVKTSCLIWLQVLA